MFISQTMGRLVWKDQTSVLKINQTIMRSNNFMTHLMTLMKMTEWMFYCSIWYTVCRCLQVLGQCFQCSPQPTLWNQSSSSLESPALLQYIPCCPNNNWMGMNGDNMLYNIWQRVRILNSTSSAQEIQKLHVKWSWLWSLTYINKKNCNIETGK